MLVMPHTSFIDSFNDYAGNLGAEGNAYDTVLEGGGAAPAFSWEQTLLAMTWPFYGASFLVQSAYWAGEHKTGLRAHLLGMTLPFVMAFLVMLLAVAAAMRAFSLDFLNAVGLADPASYGMAFAPYYVELAGTWTGPVIAILLALGLGAWFLTYVPFITIMVTRSMLAWSFDGVMPEWLGRVDERTNNPINATLVTFAVSIFFLALYSFTDAFSVVTALLGFAITFLITCLAAVAFPYRRRELFSQSPAAQRVGGVPLLSIAGALGAVGCAAMIVVFLRDPSSGTNWPLNKNQVYGIVAALVVAAVVYAISAAARRNQGVDIGAAYEALPPE
jgi:amino acid transporter